MSSLDFLVWLEHLRSPLLDDLFAGLSALGSEPGYMALVVAVYLCVGHRLGFHLFVLYLTAALSAGIAKEFVDVARPFVMYPDQLHPLSPDTVIGSAFPSGHATEAAVVWGLIAIQQETWARRAVPLLAIAGIGFSRLYCQLHWPADVFGGFALGGLVLLSYLLIVGSWKTSGKRLSPRMRTGLIIGASAAFYVMGLHEEACLSAGGALLGAGLGYTLLELRGGYNAHAPRLTQLLKVTIALAAIVGIKAWGEVLVGGSPPGVFATYFLATFTSMYLLPMFYTGFFLWRIRARQALEMIEQEELKGSQDALD